VFMKRVALYMRVSSLDQKPESQLYDLQQLASQRSYGVVKEYTDKISGAKARRPALDKLLYDARRRRFDVVMVWAFDRMARSVRHLLSVLDELGQLNIEFVSFRENIDTGGALGRAMVVIVGAIAELERSLITERVRAGMRRARLEGIQLGRRPLDVDRASIVSDCLSGMSLTTVGKKHGVSRGTVCRLVKLAGLANGQAERLAPFTEQPVTNPCFRLNDFERRVANIGL
jgi:DNA invertase Pin-like site-specific DNA recombinase